MSKAALRALLHAGKLKATPRRLAVAGLLARSGRTFTADEVHARLRPQLGRLGLQTVYRILEELTGTGLLARVVRADGLRSYAVCRHGPAHHHHIICTDCGRVAAVECRFPGRQRRRVEAKTGFRVTGHSMQLAGLCPSCLKAGRGR